MLRLMVSTDKNLRNHIESALKKRAPGIKAQARRFNQIRADLVQMAMATPVRQQYTIPLPLDVDELFDFDGSGGMWADVDGGIDVEVVPPVWMADEDIRMAIPAMLQRRRAGEEVHRVKQEMVYLADSLFRRLRVVDALIQCCKGTSCQPIEGRPWSLTALSIDPPLLFQLQQYQRRLVSIGSEWRRQLRFISTAFKDWPADLEYHPLDGEPANGDDLGEDIDEGEPVDDALMDVMVDWVRYSASEGGMERDHAIR